jgi:hypothetical protein
VSRRGAKGGLAALAALAALILGASSSAAEEPAVEDTTPPVILSLTLSDTVFGATQSGPSISIREGGTTVTYVLSEEALVNFTVQRAEPGVRRGGTCAKRTGPTPKAAKRCTRYVSLRPVLVEEGTVDENGFRFNGRLAGAKLKPGRYRLSVEAVDLAGNRSAEPVLRGFRIVA